jgi:hypothetical protein
VAGIGIVIVPVARRGSVFAVGSARPNQERATIDGEVPEFFGFGQGKVTIKVEQDEIGVRNASGIREDNPLGLKALTCVHHSLE